MIIVDTALKAREAEGRPIRVGIVGAGFMGQGLTNQIVNSVPGMRVVGDLEPAARARRATSSATRASSRRSSTRRRASTTSSRRAAPRAPTTRSSSAAASTSTSICEVTGASSSAHRSRLEAFAHGKDVVLMNAELEATIGPILNVYADQHGVIMSACDGDEPGVQLNLYRWVKGLGLEPRVIGNVKGLQDPYRNPTTQKGFAETVGPEPRDGHVVRGRLEDLVRAGDRRERHRLHRRSSAGCRAASSTATT